MKKAVPKNDHRLIEEDEIVVDRNLNRSAEWFPQRRRADFPKNRFTEAVADLVKSRWWVGAIRLRRAVSGRE